MPKYRIREHKNAISPWALERSFDGKQWTVLAYFLTRAEAADVMAQYQRSWDGPNSYVG